MQQKILWAEVLKETEKKKSRWKIRDLLADSRCGQAALDFLASTDVGRLVPPLEEGDARGEVPEWELREHREREEEQEAEAEELGGGGTAAVPAHALLHGIGRRRVGDGRFSFVTFLCGFLGAHLIFLGQAWAEGKGELATCRHCADCGRENWVKCTPP